MNFRLATIQDLSQIKHIYRQIVRKMNEDKIQIWDDIYPCEFFEDDIKNKQLYLMLEDTVIVSAFVLCNSNSGQNAVEWNDTSGKALYLDRLGVNVNYLRKGVGGSMLAKAKEITKSLGVEYLRLFVVDINIPAIRLYSRNGFTRVNGLYKEVIDKECILYEYGYEIELKK